MCQKTVAQVHLITNDKDYRKSQPRGQETPDQWERRPANNMKGRSRRENCSLEKCLHEHVEGTEVSKVMTTGCTNNIEQEELELKKCLNRGSRGLQVDEKVELKKCFNNYYKGVAAHGRPTHTPLAIFPFH